MHVCQRQECSFYRSHREKGVIPLRFGGIAELRRGVLF